MNTAQPTTATAPTTTASSSAQPQASTTSPTTGPTLQQILSGGNMTGAGLSPELQAILNLYLASSNQQQNNTANAQAAQSAGNQLAAMGGT